MARLIKRDFAEIVRQSSTQAVFELRRAMGGGKTHGMLALGMLARNRSMYDKVP